MEEKNEEEDEEPITISTNSSTGDAPLWKFEGFADGLFPSTTTEEKIEDLKPITTSTYISTSDAPLWPSKDLADVSFAPKGFAMTDCVPCAKEFLANGGCGQFRNGRLPVSKLHEGCRGCDRIIIERCQII
jgi:hypothetical protein